MNDYESLRPTDADIDTEFTPEIRREVYLQALAQATAPRRGRTAWFVVAGVAAAAVTAAAFAIPAMMHPASDDVTVTPPGQVVSTQPAPTPDPQQLALVMYAPGTPVGPDVLEDVAATAAATEMAAVTSGSYLKLVSISSNTETNETITRESYVDGDGWTWVHETTDTGRSDWWLFGTLTSAWVKDLPTDAAELDAALRSGSGSNSEDERVYKGINEVLVSEVASPELRSAAIQALQNIAANPRAAAPDKEGNVATPKVEVLELTLPDGATGYRVTFTDPGTREGVSYSMVLDSSGLVLETVTSYDGSDPEFPEPSNHTSQIQVRELVTELPDEFVTALGTEHVEQS